MSVRKPFWYQKKTKRRNRYKIVSALRKEPLTFTQLEKRVLPLTKTTLRNHLKSMEKEGMVERALIEKRTVYRLTKSALRLPLLHIMTFETIAYFRILRELFEEGNPVPIILREKTTYLEEKTLFKDIDPYFLAQTSESDLIRAFDKWLAPIILYAVVRQLKTENDWTEVIHGVIGKAMNLIKRKDMQSFEEALREYFAKRFDGYMKTPVIDSLDYALDSAKKQE